MTRDEIISMAREAGFRTGSIELHSGAPLPFVAPVSATNCLPEVERLVSIAAAAERTAMAYHRCAQLKKENDELRAKIEAMERQEPLITVLREPDYWSNGHFHKGTKPYISLKQLSKLKIGDNLYTLPGAKGE